MTTPEVTGSMDEMPKTAKLLIMLVYFTRQVGGKSPLVAGPLSEMNKYLAQTSHGKIDG